MLSYLFSSSSVGNKHILAEQPSEDFAGFTNDPYKLIAVADGHSDKLCSRASIGSRLAIEACIKLIVDINNSYDLYTLLNILSDENRRSFFIRDFFAGILAEWNDLISNHINNEPLTENEEQFLPCPMKRFYGTTLLVAIVIGHYLIMIQQGDGYFVVIHETGCIDQPLEPDPNCNREMGETTSLCDENAVDEMRFHVIDLEQDNIIACMAMSDGVESASFLGERLNMLTTAIMIASLNFQDNDSFEKWLNDFLPSYDVYEGQDDRSLAGMVDIAALKTYNEYLQLYIKYVQMKTISEKKTKELPIIERNISVLKDLRESKEELINYNTKQLNKTNTILEQINCRLGRVNELKESYSKIIEEAEQALSNYEKRFDYLIQKKNSLEKYKENTEGSLMELSGLMDIALNSAIKKRATENTEDRKDVFNE